MPPAQFTLPSFEHPSHAPPPVSHRQATKNCVGIAALETLRLLGGAPACGVGLRLAKGLPLGSGMGSSAASAAAAALATNALFGAPLPKEALVPAGLASEAAVSGYHADNIAPALLGGFILIRSCDPLDLQARGPEGGGTVQNQQRQRTCACHNPPPTPPRPAPPPPPRLSAWPSPATSGLCWSTPASRRPRRRCVRCCRARCP